MFNFCHRYLLRVGKNKELITRECVISSCDRTPYFFVPYFTVEAPVSNKRPPPFLPKKSCVGLIALELAPTVNYWFKG